MQDWIDKLNRAVTSATDEHPDYKIFNTSFKSVLITWENKYQDDVGLEKFLMTLKDHLNQEGIEWAESEKLERMEYFKPQQNWTSKYKLQEYVDWLNLHHAKVILDAKCIAVYNYFIRYLNTQNGSDFIVKTNVSTISQKTGWSGRSVKYAIHQLKSLGLLAEIYLAHNQYQFSKYKIVGYSYLIKTYKKYVLKPKVGGAAGALANLVGGAAGASGGAAGASGGAAVTVGGAGAAHNKY